MRDVHPTKCQSANILSNKCFINIVVNRYQSTQSAIKSTAEKTTSILGGITSGITSGISSKLSQMKKSDSYRSIEERVGGAYENVKVKDNQNKENDC